jgi:hypothetical protein
MSQLIIKFIKQIMKAPKIASRFLVLGIFVFVFFGQVAGDNFLVVGKAEAANITISGTLYKADGTPDVQSPGKTIKIIVGTSTPSTHSTTTDINGAWSISNIDDTELLPSTALVVWLDNEDDNATAVIMNEDSYGIDGTTVNLQVGDVGLYGGVAIEGTTLLFYDSTDDDDILYTATAATTTILGDLNIGDADSYASVYHGETNALEVRGSYSNPSNSYSVTDSTSLIYMNNLKTEITSFLGGRDANGLSNGTSSVLVQTFAVSGNYLYVGKDANSTACSQAVGGAIGCELMVFDISSTTNPIYRAGRDVSGSSNGTGALLIYSLKVVGDYLFVGKNADATNACSQTSGSVGATACELMVFDISSTTNPIYRAGRDVSGSSNGSGGVAIRGLALDYYTGDYLYVAKNGDATSCSQTVGSATGCELLVFDISSTTNPTMKAARNASGQSSGTQNSTFFSVFAYENTLYIGKAGNATDCSATPGAGANGCEIQFYDISSTTDPTYYYGRDTNGAASDTNGTDSSAVYSVSVRRMSDVLYIYVGKAANGTACDPVEGSAVGCELLIFTYDSDLGDFILTSAFDSDGSTSGTSSLAINAVVASENYLYIGKGANGTACSQTAGSAIGCELMVFDISDHYYPIYVAGVDSGGSATGTINSQITDLLFHNNNLWMGKGATATACNPTAGSATGCELQYYKAIPGSVFYDPNNLYDTNLVTNGYNYLSTILSLNDLVISPNSTTTANDLYVSGDFKNYGNFFHNENKTVYLVGTNQSLDASATTTFKNLNKTTTVADTLTFSAGDTYIATGVLTLNGDISNLLSLRSSSAGSQWYIDYGSKSVSHLDVKDSNNINAVAISCTSQCLDSGNNTNWSIVTTYLTMSGTLYTNEGTTPGSSGKTIKVAVGESTPVVYSTTTASLGVWQFSNIIDFYLTTSTPITVWLDGDASDATTLVEGYSGSSITSVPLYYGYTLVNATSSNAYLNADSFSFYDSVDDSDILYTVTGTSTVINSNFLIKQGNFIAPSSTLIISGNFKNNSTFDSNDGEVILTGSSKTIDGTVKGSSAFGDLIINGSYTMATSLASTTNLFISSGGSLTASSGLTVAGNFTNNNTFNANSGTVFMHNVRDEVISYLAGRDTRGDGSGIGGADINDMLVNGNYLYVGKSGIGTACSQTSGHSGVTGCELMVFDISSSTNPVYVAGRDASGSSSGTATVAIRSLVIYDNYLYAAKNSNGTACSQSSGSAEGCEIIRFSISSSTNPVYTSGRDADGSSNGTTSVSVNQIINVGNYLYVVKNSNGTACSQTSGLAIGCELMVFDIQPGYFNYVAGRDARGDASGATGLMVETIINSGNYLYIGKMANGTACSQSSTNATGCELMVFDISSSTNPVYVAGRDASGSSSGTSSLNINKVLVSNDYLYIGKDNDATACSQVSGSATGCELMVFDISSSTNPVYVAGRDASGSSSGTGDIIVSALAVSNNYLYVGKDPDDCTSDEGCELMVFDISSSTNPSLKYGVNTDGDKGASSTVGVNQIYVNGGDLLVAKDGSATACSQVSGSATGCELMVFSKPAGLISGNLTGSNSFYNLSVQDGMANFVNNASATNVTISTSTYLTAPSALTISGNLSNYGTYNHSSGTVTLSGASQSLVSPATTTFYSLTKSVSSADTLTFTAGGTYITEGILTLNGATSNLLSLRSSSNGSQWYVDPKATTSLSYLDVKDSNNLNVTSVTCDTGCLNTSNNTNWEFGEIASLVSEDNYHFYVGQATATLDQITITKLSSATDIITTNDLRISIATTTTNFRFNTSNTSLTFTGTASGKVSGTVSYENSGATLVINVTTNFAQDDTLIISGIQVGSFAGVSTTSSQLSLYTSGSISGTPTAEDTRTINITGSVVVSDHTLGQVNNQFGFQNKADEAMFAFSLVPSSENATVTDIVFTLSGIQGIETGEFSDFKLYRDNNSDRAIDGGDDLIDGSGIMTTNGQHGAITFSSNFLVNGDEDYIVTADTSVIDRDDSLVIKLLTTGITAVGISSAYTSVIIGTPDDIQHERHVAAGGGGSARIGDDAPAGNGVVTGGEDSGGGGADQESDGENIADDPNFMQPTATGDVHNEWTNPSNALLSDGTYATAGSNGLRQSYNGFSFGIAGGNTIQGIAVKLDASGSTANGTIDVSLSWDGGSSYTTAKATPTLAGSDIVYTVGGSSDTWGRSWAVSEFDPANFRIRVTSVPSSNTLRLDALEIRVFHQTGGGGAGGGGGGGGI